MKKKSSLILDNEFIQYCELNNIDDIDKIAKETFNRGFSLLKYGETPTGNSRERIVEKEVIVEKIIYQDVIKEVEVEKVVEKIVEVIKEVPVEKIIEVIKEVPVERIVEVIKEVPIEIKGNTKVITKEVIKEVPIDRIVEVIKEVPVEKIIEVIKEVQVIKEVTNEKELQKLTEENISLRHELDSIKKSLDKFNKATYMKNSDLGSLYDE
jgi:hypothetical protein